MGILTETVEVKPTGKMIQYYRDKGYKAEWRKSLTVKVEDLPVRSMMSIVVECDICGKQNELPYSEYNICIENGGYYCCRGCFNFKVVATNRQRYNCDNVMQNKDIHKKQIESLKENYGVDNPLKSEEIKKRAQDTTLKHYGVLYPSQNEDIREKITCTVNKHYGVSHPAQSLEVKEKTKQTCMQNWGVENPAQLPEIREKMNKTLYINGSQKVSRQQLYIYNVYNNIGIVKLNFPLKYYSLDICFSEEKIDVEYDGGFHSGNVITGRITKEEFNQKEIIRNNVIKREGYKQMHIISSKDKLPSDEKLLEMFFEAKHYFSTTSHTWVNYDIDNSIMINAENKSLGGVPYDYGELRTIKD